MVISEADKSSSDSDLAVVNVTYEVHSFGISFILKNFIGQQVMRAAAWSAQTTFTSLYPRDVAHTPMGTFFIVLMVAA